MKLHRLLLGLGVVLALVSLAVVGREAEPTPSRMVTAADKFLSLLTADQKAKAAFAFTSPERINWNFVPLQDKEKKPTRKGLRFEEMTAEQKKAALALLETGTSPEGYKKATTIMSLESILADLESKAPNNVRSPEWYFVSIYGTPAKTGKWGWRIEGHHLSLSYTLDGAKILAATPAFFGANPAEVKTGDRKGLRTLAEAEDHAIQLFESLSNDQRALAAQPKQFPEIEQGKAKPNLGAPLGIPGEKLTTAQKDLLWKLLDGYANRLPTDVGGEQLAAVKKAGLDKVYFAFAREDSKPGKPYTYRVQGPTFAIEFLNIQADSANNPANHIHSVWRNLAGDFGLAE
jgi:hypothetical protein